MWNESLKSGQIILKKGGEIIVKKFFILLMVVLMLAGLASTSFAGNGYVYAGENGYDGECNPDCPNPDCPNP